MIAKIHPGHTRSRSWNTRLEVQSVNATDGELNITVQSRRHGSRWLSDAFDLQLGWANLSAAHAAPVMADAISGLWYFALPCTRLVDYLRLDLVSTDQDGDLLCIADLVRRFPADRPLRIRDTGPVPGHRLDTCVPGYSAWAVGMAAITAMRDHAGRPARPWASAPDFDIGHMAEIAAVATRQLQRRADPAAIAVAMDWLSRFAERFGEEPVSHSTQSLVITWSPTQTRPHDLHHLIVQTLDGDGNRDKTVLLADPDAFALTHLPQHTLSGAAVREIEASLDTLLRD